MLIAVDFDDTIATNRYPFVGEIIPYAKEIINFLHEEGHLIMLWTVRGTEKINELGYIDSKGKNSSLDNAKKFCMDNGIHIDYYNFNPSHPSNSPKQLADIVIDDINLGCPTKLFKNRLCVDWLEVGRLLVNKGFIRMGQLEILIADEKKTNSREGKLLNEIWLPKKGYVGSLKARIGEDMFNELLNIGIININIFGTLWMLTDFGQRYCKELFENGE